MLKLLKNLLLFGWLSAAFNWLKTRCCNKKKNEEQEKEEE